MSERYKHISSPMKIRSMTLKSRFLYPCAQPHFLAGPELYPSESLTAFYEAIAKNGAAIITVHDLANDYQRSSPGFDICHFAMWDITDPGCQNYFTHFSNHLHYYGSIVCSSMNVDMEVNWTVNPPNARGFDSMSSMMGNGSDEYGDEYVFGAIVGPEGKTEMSSLGAERPVPEQFTAETIKEYIRIFTDRCLQYQSLGFNAGLINLHSYIGEFFRESTNHRTDEYGGSYENRCRFLHQFLGELRKAVGDSYLIILGCPQPAMGWTEEEIAALVKETESYCDLLHLRMIIAEIGEREACEQAPAVDFSARLKQLGVKMPIAVNTPYMDLDKLDEIIASGKADMISSNHMFMCNDKIGDIMAHGNGEDLEPCLLCHACRGLSWKGDWVSRCTINPKMGMEYRVRQMTEPFQSSKKVAIIGGGPGAMRCALYLKERGHVPEIYEKSGELGGQIKTSRGCDFKWRMERYLDWLIAQLDSKAVACYLNTEATPEMIKAKGYDAVIAATGAEPKLPDLPGAELAAKWNVVNIYGNEDKIGQRVVIVGGASSAAEAGIHLAREGHDVTVLCRKNIIAHDLNPIRQRGIYNKYAHQNGVKIEKNAVTTRIEKDRIWFVDQDGQERFIEYDDAIVSGGMSPNRDSAIAFHGTADEFYMIGDCREAQNLRLAIRDAYAVAMRIK